MRHGLLALLATFACTPDTTGPVSAAAPAGALAAARVVPPVTTHPRPRDAAESAAWEAPLRCDRAIRCGEIGASERERCLRVTRRKSVLHGTERALKAGRYRFDPALAADCLKFLAEAPCHVAYEVIPDGCLSDAGLYPAVPPGGACEHKDECIEGTCTGTIGCPGVCRAHTSEVGGRCDRDTPCSEHLFCGGETCRPRGDLGAACSGIGGTGEGCRPGLLCQYPPDGGPHEPRLARPGTCQPPRGLGQSCRRTVLDHDDCAVEYFCDFGLAVPVCRVRLPAGAACPSVDACADGLRCDGLWLADRSTVSDIGHMVRRDEVRAVVRPGVCRPVADQGSACEFTADGTRCPADMLCSEDGVCVARRDTGSACESDDDCGDTLFCDPTSGTCRPELDLGEPCSPVATDDDACMFQTCDPCLFGTCDPSTRRCVPDCRPDD
ncbi:hypothetical protein OV079_30255 [Nannocystis pusilla]|uniref:Dickkopf N-terminal cysteine-rich domain-containing protein n=1 Tax=Nannocystis pusilla TaxID=889268 RepID=A0A9X3F1Q0_9BACT|nr:hypothetical protein [Nannocystis pusilla]MCY1009771.1 hypothetical protein [Nannocystis pusilla]